MDSRSDQSRRSIAALAKRSQGRKRPIPRTGILPNTNTSVEDVDATFEPT